VRLMGWASRPKRTKVVRVRLTDAAYAALERLAETAHATPEAFLEQTVGQLATEAVLRRRRQPKSRPVGGSTSPGYL
jgi:hypothetical protein